MRVFVIKHLQERNFDGLINWQIDGSLRKWSNINNRICFIIVFNVLHFANRIFNLLK